MNSYQAGEIKLTKQGYWLVALLILLILTACANADEESAGSTTASTLPPVTFDNDNIIIPPTSPVTPRPESSDGSDSGQTAAESTPSPPPTATLIPTATPLPADRLALGLRFVETGNYGEAIEQLSGAFGQGLSDAEEQQARLALGEAYLATFQYQSAAERLNQYLAQQAGPAPAAPLGSTELNHPDLAYGLLAQAYQGLGDGEAARSAYQTYLLANPDMAFYVQNAIAGSYLSEGDSEAAANARSLALTASAHKNIYVEALYQQGAYLQATEQYELAAAEYLKILDVAVTDTTRGDALYQAGTAQLLAGNETVAYELFERAFNDYPEAYTSYLGLVELVEAGIVVDEYQRGLVDYYAGAYQPALDAFERYIQTQEAISATVAAEVYRWQAYSHEGLGNVMAAAESLARYGESEPAAAVLETAQLYFRADQWENSRQSYIEYTDTFSQTNEAPQAAWWAARLTEIFGEPIEAAERYALLAERYPGTEDVPRALFRAGFLWVNEGLDEPATAVWQQLQSTYPDNQYAAAAAIWLVRSDLDSTALDNASAFTGFSYYHLRAQDIATNRVPFTAIGSLNLVTTASEQTEAETWLREAVGIADDVNLDGLSPSLMTDDRLVRGWKLWQLGQLELAKRELEAVRISYNGDAAATYQLAIFFRDIGLYRSSILAGANLLGLTGSTVFSAPRFLGSLVYPVHYVDLVVPLAAKYGYDPLLQFALIRQESLYETFISSPVGAQGLSQVMPATGDYIAGQLAWPNYQTALLLDPYVGLNFGAFYLDQQLNGFDGSAHAALAAYNAGPGNAARWYAEAGNDIDLFVETIDFIETRTYIERIYVGHTIYRLLYGVE